MEQWRVEHHLKRISLAARAYYFAVETGHCLDQSDMNSVKMEQIRSEMFSALMDYFHYRLLPRESI